jgi:hypothetical protein
MKAWLGILTAALVLLTAGLVVGLATLNADVQKLDAQLSDAIGGRDSGDAAWPVAPDATAVPTLDARIVGTSATSSTLAVTITVRFSGPADLLAEPPVLRGGSGKLYGATPDSLSQARFAFLDLVSKGYATAAFVFQGAIDTKESLTLVFNSGHRATDVVAPKRQVQIR